MLGHSLIGCHGFCHIAQFFYYFYAFVLSFLPLPGIMERGSDTAGGCGDVLFQFLRVGHKTVNGFHQNRHSLSFSYLNAGQDSHSGTIQPRVRL